jgi:hypothetical protein
MSPQSKLLVAVPLASAMMFAQSLATETTAAPEVRAYSYTGDIVNANCYQAAMIVNRNSRRGYPPVPASSAFTPRDHKPVPSASPRKKREILRHCSINPGTTEFALLNDDGNFFKLDEKGNLEVASHVTPGKAGPRPVGRRIRVLVRGAVDGAILNVQSVSKM